MRQHRLFVRSLVAVMIALLWVVMWQVPAQAAPARPQVAWERDISQRIHPTAGMFSGLDGSVTVASCANRSDNLLTVDHTNTVATSVPSNRAVYPCANGNTWAVATNGTIYTMALLASSDYRPKIAAYRNGRAIWPSGGYIATPASCETPSVWLTALRFGADGYLYAGSWDQEGCSTNSFHLSKIDPLSGAVLYSKSLDTQPAELIVHRHGIALFYPHNQQLRFFDYDGFEQQSQTVYQRVTLAPQHAALNGRMFFGVDLNQPHGACSDSNITDAITGYSLQGELWQPYMLPECSTLMSLRPTPSGGALALVRLQTNSGVDENRLIAVHGDGTLLWEEILPADESHGDGRRMFNLGRAVANVDMYGNVVVWREYQFGAQKFAQLTVRNGGTGSTEWLHYTETLDAASSMIEDPQNIAMSYGRLYVALHTSTSPARLYALNIPGLGLDYPRGVINRGT